MGETPSKFVELFSPAGHLLPAVASSSLRLRTCSRLLSYWSSNPFLVYCFLVSITSDVQRLSLAVE